MLIFFLSISSSSGINKTEERKFCVWKKIFSLSYVVTLALTEEKKGLGKPKQEGGGIKTTLLHGCYV